ncbi:glycerophosphodiester phosphodiesterase [Microcella alkalica]
MSVSAAACIALVLVMVVDHDAATVHAANMWGTLREPGQPAFIAGHRGDRATAPENTIPAIQAALDSSMEFVEIDVRTTLDGEPVLIHDETLERTTTGTGLVEERLWAELRELDAGTWYAPEWAGTRIPHFDDFIDVFTISRKKALVELKDIWSEDELESIVSAIYVAGVQDRIVFASFEIGTLHNLARAAPNLPRVVLRRTLPADPVRLAQYYGAAAVMTRLAEVRARPEVVGAMHEAGLGIMLYTLNSEESWSEALAYGVDGVVTDEPSALDDWLAATAPGT